MGDRRPRPHGLPSWYGSGVTSSWLLSSWRLSSSLPCRFSPPFHTGLTVQQCEDGKSRGEDGKLRRDVVCVIAIAVHGRL